MSSLWADMRFAVRSLRRRPAFVAAVVATLALGMGANTAVFSLVDRVILHPLPVADADALVAIYEANTTTPYGQSSLRLYRQFLERRAGFQGLSAYYQTSVTFTDGDDSEDLSAAFVTENYFTVLGVQPGVGRTLGPADSSASGGAPLVVLSDALWRRRFGGDAGIVGQTIRLAGQPLTVVGVAPEGFRGTNLSAVTDVWLPLSMMAPLRAGFYGRVGVFDRGDRVRLFSLFGRMAPGMTRESAAARLEAIDRQVNTESVADPSARASSRISVVPLAESAAAVRDRESLLTFIRLLFGVVTLTLVLACVNVANLLVVRTAERAKEIGVRVALGAGAMRLARHLLVESLLLSLAGGLAGLVVAIASLKLLSHFTLPGGLTLDRLELGIDARVLLFTGAICGVTTAVFGLVPAVQAVRRNVSDALADRGGQTSTRGRRLLLAVQVSISVVLLVGAGLFLHSLRRGLSTDLGFNPGPLVAINVRPELDARHDVVVQQATQVLARLATVPGATAVAAASHVPLAGARQLPFASGPATTTPSPSRATVLSAMASVTPDFFDALGIPIVQGRAFDGRDQASSPIVTILNESAARAFWPNESAIGKQINLFDDRTYTVVGVVRDVKYSTLQDRGVPFAYAPLAQESVRGLVTFVVRSGNPRSIAGVLRQHVSTAAPGLRVSDAQLLDSRIDAVLMPQRFGATLLSIFAIVAVCVSGVGIYGTVAYIVARRTTEIGVRIALGAQRRDILGLVLLDSAIAVAAGAALGLVGASVSSKLLEHFLYEISASDWVSYSWAVIVIAGTAFAAVVVPAVRAVRIDPVRAIRST